MTGPRLLSSSGFVKGEGVRLWLNFADPETGQPVDPVEPVTVTVDPPAASPMPASRTLTATRKRRGVYFADTPADLVGWWTARGVDSGPNAGRGVDEGVFEVKASRMR
jgi:hypothetical protein